MLSVHVTVSKLFKHLPSGRYMEYEWSMYVHSMCMFRIDIHSHPKKSLGHKKCLVQQFIYIDPKFFL